MPIKLNLLAEAQAAEELRRKDPVKRAIWVGSFVVFAMLLWSAVLYWQSSAATAEQKRYEEEWKSLEAKFNALTADRKLTADLNKKIESLERYRTNRFLWGSTLNAVQQSIPPQLANVIQMVRLNGTHIYEKTEAVPAKKKAGKTEPGKPATATERITITFEARDYGNPADQNFNKFKSSILAVPYFGELMNSESIRLKSVGQPVRDMVADREYALFTLECQLPPRKRNE